MWRRNSPSYNLAMRANPRTPSHPPRGSMNSLRPNRATLAAPARKGRERAGCQLIGVVMTLGLLSACGSSGRAGVETGAGGAVGAAGTGGASTLAGGGSAGDSGAVGQGGATSIGTDLGQLTFESVATWQGDAKGAYTIIHDDICDYNIDSLFDLAEPELTQRGLRSAFGAIVQRCEERKLWPELELIRRNGHEIINHSWDHKNLVEEAATAPLSMEVDHATDVLDANLAGQKTSFFIFPYDSFNDAAIAHLSSRGYLGARAGEKGVNAADFPDGMRVRFDVYGGENSIYDGEGDILKIYVDLAIAEGGWSVREFHGIADMTFYPMDLTSYREHLDYVKSKVDSGELWVDTPSRVVRYRFSREHCGVPEVSRGALSFPPASADCARYGTPLSIIVSTEVDADSLLATQAGSLLPTRKLAPKRFLVDVDPLLGRVELGGG
jgi:peptidoglycan/xylan/chitin deacetylase (PgdA/CDA1 family)